MGPGMEDSVDSSPPCVDHCDAQWIPAFAGMPKKDQSPRSHGFPSFPQNAPRHSREGGNPQRRSSHETPAIHVMANNPTERSTYRRDQQPEKAGACGRSTFRNLRSSHDTASCGAWVSQQFRKKLGPFVDSSIKYQYIRALLEIICQKGKIADNP